MIPNESQAPALADFDAELIYPTLADLKTFRYAPGGYIRNCAKCKNEAADVDKRAWICRDCAVAFFYASKLRPSPAGDKGQLTPGLDLEAMYRVADRWEDGYCDMEELGKMFKDIAHLRSLPSSPLTPARPMKLEAEAYEGVQPSLRVNDMWHYMHPLIAREIAYRINHFEAPPPNTTKGEG